VEDLDTTLAFYRDVFGINGTAQDFANAAVPILTNAPGVTLRLSMVTLPGGTRFELTHFKGPERKPGRAKYTDPGASSLVLHVTGLDELVAKAKAAKAEIVTTGGAPVTSNGRTIVLRDPDGYFLQLVEAGPGPGAVQRVTLAVTMENADATKNFYTGMMGIDLEGAPAFKKDANFAKLIGAPADVEFRTLTGNLPGATPTQIVFTEFRGVPRAKFHLRVRDPGAPALCIQVTNIQGMYDQMKAAGANFISQDGKLVDFGGGTTNIFVEDPNGLNIEIFERSGTPKGKVK
jgi:catechol 2,3-dioxygenase-like lactoylglutathione lyase family enzyme